MKKANISPALLLGAYTIPDGFEYIAPVTDEKHPIGTNLIRNKRTGVYALFMAGVIESCDQAEAGRIEAEGSEA